MFTQSGVVLTENYLQGVQNMCGAAKRASLGVNMLKLLSGVRTPHLGYGDMEEFCPSRIMSTTTYAGYTVTAITAGTLVMADAVGGVLQLTGGANDGEGIQMQTDGEIVLPAVGKDIYFEARVALADADDADWFVGMANTDTNVFSTQPTALIGFAGDDGDVNLDFQVRDGGTGAAADSGTDMADGTYINLGFHVYDFVVAGTGTVMPYINGAPQTAVTANLTDEELAITFGMLNGATTANQALSLDWYWWLQLR